MIRAATHMTAGEIRYTCSGCGAVRTETVEPSFQHTWSACRPCDGEYHRYTCTEDGYSWYAPHTYGLPAVIKKVENGEPGVLRYVCQYCGEVKLTQFR